MKLNTASLLGAGMVSITVAIAALLVIKSQPAPPPPPESYPTGWQYTNVNGSGTGLAFTPAKRPTEMLEDHFLSEMGTDGWELITRRELAIAGLTNQFGMQQSRLIYTFKRPLPKAAEAPVPAPEDTPPAAPVDK